MKAIAQQALLTARIDGRDLVALQVRQMNRPCETNEDPGSTVPIATDVARGGNRL